MKIITEVISGKVRHVPTSPTAYRFEFGPAYTAAWTQWEWYAMDDLIAAINGLAVIPQWKGTHAPSRPTIRHLAQLIRLETFFPVSGKSGPYFVWLIERGMETRVCVNDIALCPFPYAAPSPSINRDSKPEDKLFVVKLWGDAILAAVRSGLCEIGCRGNSNEPTYKGFTLSDKEIYLEEEFVNEFGPPQAVFTN